MFWSRIFRHISEVRWSLLGSCIDLLTHFWNPALNLSKKTLLIVESSNTHKDCSLKILHYCNLAFWRMFPLTLFSPTNVLARARYHWTRESAAAVHKMTDWRHRDWRRASRGSREAEQQQHPILQTTPHQSHTTSEVFSHWASSKNNGRDISQTIG